MKKIILASLLALTGSVAMAATACSAGVSTAVPGSTDGSTFVRVGFSAACSANSIVVYTDSAANQKVYGGAVSVKGASYYGGSTLGGAIQRVGACTNNSCGGTEGTSKAAAGMTAADAYGASS